MTYLCCEQLKQGITFDIHGIRFCCRIDRSINIQQIDTNCEIDINKYLSQRDFYLNEFRNGNIPKVCQGCSYLEKANKGHSNKIKFFSLAHATICSCNCIYCEFTTDKKYYNTRKHYNVLKLIKTLHDNNLIEDQAIFNLLGGECTEYKDNEFENIIDFISTNGHFAHIFTSGMFYSPIIANILHSGNGNIYVSADSGTRETFERIKQVKYYDKFWDNMKKYSAASTLNPNGFEGFVVMKYIIIPGINDNKEEFDAFINKCHEIGCKQISLSLEHKWWGENRNKNVPENLLELLVYMDKVAQPFIIEYIEGVLDIRLKTNNYTQTPEIKY